MSPAAPQPDARRPLKTRSKGWARSLAAALARGRLTPNAISVLSVVFAAGGAAALLACPLVEPWWQRCLLLVVAAFGVQLRLLCNMLDGMVAVEGGKATPVGELYNEVPDRIADALLLVALGYAAVDAPWGHGPLLGWLAAILALLTAYIRALGVAAGAAQCFLGPMAKPHRMFALTLGCLVAAGFAATPQWPAVLGSTLVLIVLGSAWTALRRLRRIAIELRALAETRA